MKQSVSVQSMAAASPTIKSEPRPAAEPASCCSPVKQASCCEPSEKPSCCGQASTGGCDCQ